MNIVNPDLKHLMRTDPYFRVPARTREQSFIAYQIKNDLDTELQHLLTSFKAHFYYLDQRPKNNVIIIVIPFSRQIKSNARDTIDLEIVDQNYQAYDYGESFRTRAKGSHFIEANVNEPNLDPTNYIIDDNPHFDIKKVKQSLKKYLNTPDFLKRSNDDYEFSRFMQSLANDVYANIYSQSDLNTILKLLSTKVTDIQTKYQNAYQVIQQSSAIRSKLNPFGQYLQLYQTSKHKGQTLADQLLSMMSNDFERNPKMALSVAGDLIAQVYQPALLYQDGKDHDNVVIFDPIRGMWIHNEDEFMGLLNALRPYSKHSELETMIDTFASEARNKSNFIKPYHESRYLLFKNCVVDVKNLEQHELDETLVKQLHFTERMRLNINYNPHVEDAPLFPGKLKAKGVDPQNNPDDAWNPWSFFMAYANNNKRKFQYLMFGLSLGLFAGHNFGVHFDIRGESRWGKTTISNIYKALFPKRVLEMVFAKFNEPFGLTNFRPDVSIVWVRECNNESDPLNSTYGTPNYDSLADGNAQIQIKSKLDLTVENPPQVYIDGTSYVKAEDMDTGPGGRTLPFKLPMEDSNQNTPKHIKELVQQAYGIGIENLLRDETVLQYLVNHMINAYRHCLHLENTDDLWDLKLNLGGRSDDDQMLPDFARQWRREMLQDQGDLADWFNYNFKEYFSKDPDHPQLMHDSLAYGFYSKSYDNKYGRQDPTGRFRLSQRNFETQFRKLISASHWQLANNTDSRGNKKRRSVKYLAKTNFNLSKFQKDGNEIPYEFTNDVIDNDHRTSSYPLAQRTSGWYQLNYEPDLLPDDQNNASKE